jgi:hypothetical protein
MRVVKLSRAQAIVDFVVSRAPSPVSVYVVDTHGELVAAASMDGAAPDTRLNAQRKAYTAARSDARSTRELAEKARDDPVERASFDPFFTFFLGRRRRARGRGPCRRGRRQRSSRRRGRAARPRRDRVFLALPHGRDRIAALEHRGARCCSRSGDGTSQPSESARRTIMLKSAATVAASRSAGSLTPAA